MRYQLDILPLKQLQYVNKMTPQESHAIGMSLLRLYAMMHLVNMGYDKSMLHELTTFLESLLVLPTMFHTLLRLHCKQNTHQVLMSLLDVMVSEALSNDTPHDYNTRLVWCIVTIVKHKPYLFEHVISMVWFNKGVEKCRCHYSYDLNCWWCDKLLEPYPLIESCLFRYLTLVEQLVLVAPPLSYGYYMHLREEMWIGLLGDRERDISRVGECTCCRECLSANQTVCPECIHCRLKLKVVQALKPVDGAKELRCLLGAIQRAGRPLTGILSQIPGSTVRHIASFLSPHPEAYNWPNLDICCSHNNLAWFNDSVVQGLLD